MALEAFRDRLKWRQVGADRLRDAGFKDDQVKRWEGEEQTTREKGAEDVQWSGKGEEREWDRGKVVTRNEVTVQAAWAKEGSGKDQKAKGGGLLNEMKRALGV